MKIYTKTGDQGDTGLLGGVRVSKSSQVIDVVGLLDETNCALGVVVSQKISSTGIPSDLVPVIAKIQNDLFDIGSQTAACLKATSGQSTNTSSAFTNQAVEKLENWIDHYQALLPELTAFILPGGSFTGSLLHQARAVCRRAERGLVGLVTADLAWPDSDPANRLSGERVYLNRLSDLLFVLARYVNSHSDCAEVQWQSCRDSDG